MNRRRTFLRMPHEADFKVYSSYIDTRNGTTYIPNVIANLKMLHKKIYYLNVLIQNLTINEKEFNYLKEVLFDLITTMDLFSLNYIKPTRMNLRAVIEGTIRFFLVKKMELGNEGVGVLIDNFKDTYSNKEYLSDKIAQISSDYGQLCNFVHTSQIQNFTTKSVLEDFKNVNNSEINIVAKQISRVIENIMFLIIYEHKDDFLKFNKFQQHWIVEQLKKEYADEINGFLIS